MRLLDSEIRVIKDVVRLHAPEARVYLFGSRADDDLKGGDIDLLLVGEAIDLRTIRTIKIALKDILGDQQIHIIAERSIERTNFGKLVELEAVEL